LGDAQTRLVVIVDEYDHCRRRPRSERPRRALDRSPAGKLHDKEYEEIRADAVIFNQRLHCSDVDCAGHWLKRRMRMPFPEVIETGVVAAGSRIEGLKGRLVFDRIADEVHGGSTRSLNGELDDAELVIVNMLAHEQAADLSRSGPTQLTTKPLEDCCCQQKTHLGSP
jgi:hypothetical protein